MENAYELFEIFSNSKKLKEFRKIYFETIDTPVLYKVMSNKPEWFSYSKGVYDADKLMKGTFFEFGMVPIKGHKFDNIITEFIEHGQTVPNSVKAIRFEGENNFLYTHSVGFLKRGKNFTSYPVLKINEDIYNLCMIQNRYFSKVTVDDLSKYSDFFSVGEEPYKIVSESSMEDLYRTGRLNIEQYKELLNSYQKEVELVKTLRR